MTSLVIYCFLNAFFHSLCLFLCSLWFFLYVIYLCDSLGCGMWVLLPVEIIPKAMKPVMLHLEKLGGKSELRTAVKKDGPIITDQGNFVLDVKFDSLHDLAELEKTINNIPGVLNNGLFVGLADLVIVGELQDGQPLVREF